jgi:hypothetical protein
VNREKKTQWRAEKRGGNKKNKAASKKNRRNVRQNLREYMG